LINRRGFNKVAAIAPLIPLSVVDNSTVEKREAYIFGPEWRRLAEELSHRQKVIDDREFWARCSFIGAVFRGTEPYLHQLFTDYNKNKLMVVDDSNMKEGDIAEFYYEFSPNLAMQSPNLIIRSTGNDPTWEVHNVYGTVSSNPCAQIYLK